MIINDNHTTVVKDGREYIACIPRGKNSAWEGRRGKRETGRARERKSAANAEGKKRNPWSLLIPSTPHQLSDLFSSSRACASDCACAGDKDLLWITWARVLFFPSLSRSGRGCTIKTSCGVRIIPCCTRNRIEQIN